MDGGSGGIATRLKRGNFLMKQKAQGASLKGVKLVAHKDGLGIKLGLAEVRARNGSNRHNKEGCVGSSLLDPKFHTVETLKENKDSNISLGFKILVSPNCLSDS